MLIINPYIFIQSILLFIQQLIFEIQTLSHPKPTSNTQIAQKWDENIFIVIFLFDSDHKYEIFFRFFIILMSSKKQSEPAEHSNIVSIP